MNQKLGRPATTIILDNDEKEELEKRIKSHTISVRDSLRAQIILLKSQGIAQEQIQVKLSISRRTVMKWVDRFIDKGLEGLSDTTGRGRKPWISDEINNMIITKATQPLKIKADGLQEQWQKKSVYQIPML